MAEQKNTDRISLCSFVSFDIAPFYSLTSGQKIISIIPVNSQNSLSRLILSLFPEKHVFRKEVFTSQETQACVYLDALTAGMTDWFLSPPVHMLVCVCSHVSHFG